MKRFIVPKKDNSLMELFNGINLVKRLVPQYIDDIFNPQTVLYDESTGGSLVTSIINGMTKKIYKTIDNMVQNDSYGEFLILKVKRLEILYKIDQYCKFIKNNVKYNQENIVNFMNEILDINKKINNYDSNSKYIRKNNSLKKLINYILKEEKELEGIIELIDSREMNISTVKLLKTL